MKRISVDFLYRGELYLLMVTFFLISFPRSWSLYPLGLFLVVGLMLWISDCKSIWKTFIINWYLVFPPIVFFLVQLINSIINSSSLFLLEDRLMFMLIPIFGFPFFSRYIDRSNFRKILLSYIAGISIIGLFFLLNLSYNLISHGDVDFFDYFKENISSFLSIGFSLYEHPTYFSLKIIWVIILIYLIPDILILKKYLKILIFTILSLNVFFLSSKAGMFSWLVVNAIFIVRYMKKKTYANLIKTITVIIFIIITLTLIIKNARFNQYIDNVQNNLNVEKIDWKSVDQRTREWYTTYNLIRNKPLLGYGINQIQDTMISMYYKYGFVLEAEMKVNAHNQLLESQVTFGIFGTISLLWLIIAPIRFKNRLKYSIIVTFFIVLTSYYLFIESMFNRQWGIMFFVLFYCILVLQKNEQEEEIFVRIQPVNKIF